MSFLVPCSTCHRHVLATEAHCPFCAAAVTDAMRVPPRGLARSGVGRAAMLVLTSTAASTAVACGGDSDDNGSREQPAEPASPASPAPGGTQSGGTDPDPSGTMSSLPGTAKPNDGKPTMTPDGEPMAVAEYGVAILPPDDPAAQPTMAMVDPPPPDPDLVPRPVYGAPALPPTNPTAMLEPEPPAMEPEALPEPETTAAGDAGAPIAPSDAGASDGDAAVPEPEAQPEPQPEPMVQPAYGVATLPVE